jgi:cobalamin biosynthesis Mg chelatase CobN
MLPSWLPFAAMRPNRHQQNPGRYRGRVSAALLALSLTSALFVPALAQAGSATQQYTESPPSATGGNPTPGSNGSPSTGGSGGASSQNQGGSGAPSGSPAAPVSGDSGTSGVEQGSTSGGTGESGSGQGGSGNGGVSGSGGSGTNGKSGKSGNQPIAITSGTPASASTDDGGSSPLVPILIAVAVLAALSIGAVLYRMRRANGAEGTEPGASAPGAP